MSNRLHRFVALLLVLCVALGPTGGALAAKHACRGGDSGLPVMTDHAAHMQLHSQSGTHGDTADSGPVGACQDCPSGCCDAAVCSANACASGIAAVTSTLLPSPGWQGNADVWPTGPQLPHREQPTSLFRPPRA